MGESGTCELGADDNRLIYSALNRTGSGAGGGNLHFVRNPQSSTRIQTLGLRDGFKIFRSSSTEMTEHKYGS